jgi:glucose-fructose oxidoreductase
VGQTYKARGTEVITNGGERVKDNSDFSRRRFLEGLLIGTAGLAFGSKLQAAEILAQNQGRKLGIALLGLGRYATGELGPALRQTKLVELRGVITGHPEKGEKWAADYSLDKKNIYSYETMDRIADNKDIDIIYVVTPPGLHAEYAIRAAKLGKHVISEKPMSTSVAACDQMIEACKAAKRELSIGYRLHFDPYHLELARLAKTQELGRFMKMNGRFAYVMGQKEHRTDKKLGGGGPLMDLGIYIVHGACMATENPPLYVTAKEAEKKKPDLFSEVEEGISFTMEFPKGEKMDAYTSFNDNGNTFHLDGEKGWMDFPGQAFSYRGVTCNTSRGALNYPPVSQQARQMDDFADCILTGRKTGVPGELGRRDIQILMAIYEAARRGQRVKVNTA